MTVDDVLARHRPEANLDPHEHAALRAALIAEPDNAPGHEGDVTTVVGERTAARSRRRAWIPAAAAAAVVLTCAGSLAAWPATDGRDTRAGGDAPSVCSASLPASWDDARSDTPLRVDGHNAVPDAGSPQGDLVLSWDATPATVSFGLLAADGETTRVTTFARATAQKLSAEATDGRHVVFASYPDPSSPPNDLLLVDAANHSRVHLLPAAPMPAGWVVRTDVALLGGYAYWGATPGPTDDSHGIVIRYSIAKRTYRVIDRPDQFPLVVSDVRGVAWPDGSVSRKNLPSALNPLLDAAGRPIDRLVTDGRDYAWQTVDGDQTTFYWADNTGDTRTYRVTIGAEHDGAGLTAVSGPFLFFHVNQAGHTESVLDTRTGALAPADTDDMVRSYPGRHLFAMTSADEYQPITPSALPGFGCD